MNPESSRAKDEHAAKKVNVLHKQDSSKYLKSSQPQQHEKVLKRAMRSSVDQARLSTGSSSVGPIAKAGKSSIYKITSGVTERSNTQTSLLACQENIVNVSTSVVKPKKLQNVSASNAAAQMSGLTNVDISQSKAQQYLYHHPSNLTKNGSQKIAPYQYSSNATQ